MNETENNLEIAAFYSILDFLRSGIVLINKKGIITNINQRTVDLTGLPPDKIIGRRSDAIFPNHPLQKTLITGELEENKISIHNGKKVINSRIPLYMNGEIVGAVAFFQDLNHLQDNEMDIRNKLIDRGYYAKYTFDNICTASPKIEKVINIARAYAKTSSTILITGETGTGKELFAQSIHNASNRKNAPFVALNCATLPENILEAELFGYSEASFTGAQKGGKTGLFQQAHRGTIFLDEIGELPLPFQSKLLRVLQEKEIRPIGSNKIIPVDVRVIAATNRNLSEEVDKGNFRMDLLYRLKVMSLRLPPLRERKEDIYAIGIHYLGENYPDVYYENMEAIHQILKSVSGHSFLGNVRELENMMDRLSLLLREHLLHNDLHGIIDQLLDLDPKVPEPEMPDSLSLTSDVTHVLENTERDSIIDTLLRHKGDKKAAARELDMGLSSLYRKLKKYNIS